MMILFLGEKNNVQNLERNSVKSIVDVLIKTKTF